MCIFKFVEKSLIVYIALVSQSPSVSGKHAVIESMNKDPNVGVSFFLQDLNSTNGTFVNHRRIPSDTKILLHCGDVIRFGYDSILYAILPAADAVDPLLSSTISADIQQLPKEPQTEQDVGNCTQQVAVVSDKPVTEKAAPIDEKHHSSQQQAIFPSQDTIQPKLELTTGFNEQILKALEQRMLELEQTAQIQKQQAFPSLEVRTIEQVLISRIFFHTQSLKRLLQDEQPNLVKIPDLQQDKLAMLEAICDEFEKNDLLGQVKQQVEKRAELAMYARAVERKLGEFRIQLWELEQLYDQSKKEKKALEEKCYGLDDELSKRDEMLQQSKKEANESRHVKYYLDILEQQNDEFQKAHEKFSKHVQQGWFKTQENKGLPFYSPSFQSFAQRVEHVRQARISAPSDFEKSKESEQFEQALHTIPVLLSHLREQFSKLCY